MWNDSNGVGLESVRSIAEKGVRRVYAGMDPRLRGSWPLVVLQAYYDDSRDKVNSNVLVLAGAIASEDNWAEFAKDWAEILSIRPQWKRFKMSEVARSGGDESFERAQHHYRVFERYADGVFAVAVPIQTLRESVAEFRLPESFANPYFLAWRSIMDLTMLFCREHRIQERVDYFFDQQGEAGQIIAAYQRLLESDPDNRRDIPRRLPKFEDDEEFLPLQAADMCAWWYRHRYEERGTLLGEESPFPWEAIGRRRGAVCEFDRESIHERLSEIAAQMALDRREV